MQIANFLSRATTKSFWVPIGLMVATTMGCALPLGPSRPLAVIQVVKNSQSSAGNCPVTVTIFNQMNGVPWDSVSYHVALRNKDNAAIGELKGIPEKYTEPGFGMVFGRQVNGVKCGEITGISVLYFGYYPTGQGQERLSTSVVSAELK